VALAVAAARECCADVRGQAICTARTSCRLTSASSSPSPAST
jgi:hypothetical protein